MFKFIDYIYFIYPCTSLFSTLSTQYMLQNTLSKVVTFLFKYSQEYSLFVYGSNQPTQEKGAGRGMETGFSRRVCGGRHCVMAPTPDIRRRPAWLVRMLHQQTYSQFGLKEAETGPDGEPSDFWDSLGRK